MKDHPTVAEASAALSAALDAAKLSKRHRAAINSAVSALRMALQDQVIDTITPASVRESLAATGEVVWLDGYQSCLRRVTCELAGVYEEAARELDKHTSDKRVEAVMLPAMGASLPLWTHTSRAEYALPSRPLSAIVEDARQRVAQLAAPVVAELPAAPDTQSTADDTHSRAGGE